MMTKNADKKEDLRYSERTAWISIYAVCRNSMDGSQLPMTFRSWVVDWKHHYFLDYLTYTSEYMKNYTFKKINFQQVK